MGSRTDRRQCCPIDGLRRWGGIGAIVLLAAITGPLTAQPTDAPPPGGDSPDRKSAVERRIAPPEVHGHDGSQLGGLSDAGFSNDETRRIQRLEVEIMCACPRENWSRTLSNCPDACADAQKSQIRTYVREGDDDAEIMKHMRETYGIRVLAAPPRDTPTARLLYMLPIIILLLAVGISGGIIALWLRSSRASGLLVATIDEEFGDTEMDRVAAELEELD